VQIPLFNPNAVYSGSTERSQPASGELAKSFIIAPGTVAPATNATSGVVQGVNLTQRMALSLLQYQGASYDQPDSKNLRAIEAYRSVDLAPKREQLSQMLGIDLYA
jgi:hypothetical protein